MRKRVTVLATKASLRNVHRGARLDMRKESMNFSSQLQGMGGLEETQVRKWGKCQLSDYEVILDRQRTKRLGEKYKVLEL